MMTTVRHLYPDIWQQIFEYFNVMELFFSLIHITEAADEILFNANHHFRLRGLVIIDHISACPDKRLLSQVASLELHQESCFDIIEQCLQLRSLKLIGQPEWAIYLLKKISQTKMKLEQLVLVVPGIGSLYDLLESIITLFSLRRLSVYANESEENVRKSRILPMTETGIEHFTLHSCCSISWNDLSHILSLLSNIRFLDVTLFDNVKDSFSRYSFPTLWYISLNILEVPFETIIQIVKTMPSLKKLKLNGLTNAEGFVTNHRWLDLFKSCSTLGIVCVNLSLERDTNFFPIDMVQMSLREVNLNLICMDDDCDHYLDPRNEHRWWSLFGRITK